MEEKKEKKVRKCEALFKMTTTTDDTRQIVAKLVDSNILTIW